MSTISTQFNLGPSYLVNDIYKAFLVKNASQKHYVFVSRCATGLVALVGVIISFYIESIADMWQFVLSFASGAGIIWILRWFWWRINAWSEFSSMICSAIVATYLKQVHPKVPFETGLLIIIAITVPVALLVTFLTPPVNDETLRDFYNRVRPGRWGWRRIAEKYGITRTPYLAKAFVNLLLGLALLFLINFGVGTLLLRSFWLGRDRDPGRGGHRRRAAEADSAGSRARGTPAVHARRPHGTSPEGLTRAPALACRARLTCRE